jgi:phenylpropionate dioxygenase-like ring-hydroxylating dioxygenase large terminal subunit
MAEKARAIKAEPLLNRYSGYRHNRMLREDPELTHVGPGTPCGEYLRRFWQPIEFSAEVTDLPKRIKILGEELVLFRDRSGRVGLLDWRCSHRGTSLEFGLVSEHGIRCCYHGWLFDVDGTILEIPSEPPTSTLKERLCHPAYPTLEFNGVVFAYFGPPELRPEFPLYDLFKVSGYRFVPGGKRAIPCNWLQVKENSMDPVHTAFLHTRVTGTQFTDEFGVIPETQYFETPIGMHYVASRRVNDLVWVRVSDFILPNLHLVPPIWEKATKEKIFNRPMLTNWAVPIDDSNTLRLGFFHIKEDDDVNWDEIMVKIMFGQTADRTFEERQRIPGDYDAQVGQGPIAVHGYEHLVSSDRGVSMCRRLIRQGIQDVKNGKDPTGVVRQPEQIVTTYAQDTVIRIPKAESQEADRKILLEAGQKVVSGAYHAA